VTRSGLSTFKACGDCHSRSARGVRFEYSHSVRMIAFKTEDRSSFDVSEDIARAVAERASSEGCQLSKGTRCFLKERLSKDELAAETP
jgi:hypothetical protein